MRGNLFRVVVWAVSTFVIILVMGTVAGCPSQGVEPNPCWHVGGSIYKCCIDGQVFIKKSGAITHVLDVNGKPQQCTRKVEAAENKP